MAEMKFILSFLFVFFTVASAARFPRDDKYTTKFDTINLDEILTNDRLLNSYFKCLMDKGTCTQEGATLKKILPDALETGCKKCSETQRKGAQKVLKHLANNKPDLFAELEKKYDPKGIYLKKYKEEANKRNIKI